MNPACLKHTCIPGTSRLFLDYLYHFDRVYKFYPANPFDPQSFHTAAAQVNFPAARRAAVVDALREQNEGSQNVSVLAEADAVAVVTGQQVGLFSGPAYTIYKAATAVRLARNLQKAGLKAVPVFWVASEDHDAAEVDHAYVFNGRMEPVRLRTGLSATGGPVGRLAVRDLPLDRLAQSLEGFPHAEAVLSAVRRAYREGATLGTSFVNLVRELTAGFDLVFLDPLQPAIREAAAPFLGQAAELAPELMDSLRTRNKELEAAGYHAQVHVDQQSSPLFLLENGARVALRWKDGQYWLRNNAFTREELQRRGAQLSPNALLRPVMQDYLLPTVAYVAGPAETAYFAQSQVLYEKLLGRMPVIVPRNGFTLLDERAGKLLDRYRLQVSDVLDYEERTREKVAARLVPPQMDETLTRARAAVDEQLAGIEAALRTFDPTLAAATHKSASKIRYQFDKLAKKSAREILRKDEQACRDAAYLSNSIYPERHLQERYYSILPFLAQHGLDLIGRLLSASSLECPDHMLRSVPDLPPLLYSD